MWTWLDWPYTTSYDCLKVDGLVQKLVEMVKKCLLKYGL